jgi:hypothetical protein
MRKQGGRCCLHAPRDLVNSLKGGPILHGRVGMCSECWESLLRLQVMPLPLRLLPSTSCKLDPSCLARTKRNGLYGW